MAKSKEVSHHRQPNKHTCPKIDAGILAINMIADWYAESKNDERMETHRKAIVKVLEELRTDNLALRMWGAREARRVDELEHEIKNLKFANQLMEK